MVWETVAKVEDEEEKPASNWTTIAKADVEEEPTPYSIDQLGTDTKHVAKGVGNAAAELVDTPYSINQLAGNLPDSVKNVGGRVLDTMFPLQRLSRAAGEYLPDEVTGKAPISELPGLKQTKALLASEEEGASKGADALRTGVEWGAGGLRKAALKGADIVPDLLMGSFATIGDYFSDTSMGELIGGGTGLGASLLRGRKIGQTADAVNAIDEVADSPVVINNGEEAGTLADLTGDKGLYDLQATLDATPEGKRAINEVELARQQQMASQLREPFGEAPTAPAQDAAGQYINDVLGDITGRTGRQSDAAQVPYRPQQQALLESDAAAERAFSDATLAEDAAQSGLATSRLPLATNQTLAQSGEGMSAVAKAARKVDDDAASVKWSEFSEQGDIDLGPAQKGVSDIYKGLSQPQKDNLNSKYSKLFRWMKGGEGATISSSDIHDEIRDMKAELNAAYQQDGGLKTADKNFEKMVNAIDSSLEDANELYGAAREATRDIYTRWGKKGTPLQDALIGPPELFGKNLPLGDELGAYHSNILKQANIEGMDDEIANRLKSLARRSKTGVDDGFMAEYESVMDLMPTEFRRQADAFMEAGQKADSASALTESAKKVRDATVKANTAEGKVLTKALDAEQSKIADSGKGLTKTVGKSNLAKYSKDPAKTVSNLISSGDSAGLKALGRQIDGTSPEARDGFKAMVGRQLLDKLSKGGDAAGLRAIDGLDAPITPKAFSEFSDMRATLIDSGLIDTATADKMQEILRKTKSSSMRSDGTSRLFASTGKGSDLASSALAVAAAQMIPGTNSSLVMTGALKKFFKTRLSSIKENSQTHKILNEMILDPQKYLDGVKTAKNSKEATRMIISKINAAIQAESALTGE
jgi:hypothetical protein